MTVFEHVNWRDFFQVKTFADFGAWSFLFIDLQDDCAGKLSMIYFPRGVAPLCHQAEIYRTFRPEMQGMVYNSKCPDRAKYFSPE